MIECKKCAYIGAYEGKCCPSCGAPYTLTESEVGALLDEARRAKENKEMETVAQNYRMLADFGIPEAQREYGLVLEREGEYARASKLYRLAAEAGDATAAYRFALRNVELHDGARRFWLSYAAILGCKESFAVAAEELSRAGDERAADYFYRHAAACDDVGAIVALAKRYADGVGCEKNEGYAKWFMDKLTLPPIHAIRLAFRLHSVAAEEPPVPVCDFYEDFVRALVSEAQRCGYLGARLYLMELLAERGNLSALVELADLYLSGIGTPVRVEAAIHALNTAATSGSAEAHRVLGDLYFVGEQTAADVPLAIRHYRRAAELGDGDAMLRLGRIYFEGDALEQDIPKALSLFEEAERAGCAEAGARAARIKEQRESAYYLAMEQRRSNATEAYRLFTASASMGYTPAYTRLGDCYTFGLGTAVDRRTGFLWYEAAVKAGEEDALYPLGLCYARGIGVGFDYRHALKILRAAARAGNEDAEREITRLQRNRLKKELRSLFSRAMRLLYRHRYTEAFRIFWMLDRMDEAEATYFLGACYEFGIGTEADRTKAFAAYGRAADLGFVDERAYRKGIFLRMIR